MTNRNPLTQKEQKALLKIAKENILAMKERGTFEAAYRDDDDFFEVAVWSLEVAMTEAYLLGKKNATQE
mgnify:CR=1 FL=1